MTLNLKTILNKIIPFSQLMAVTALIILIHLYCIYGGNIYAYVTICGFISTYYLGRAWIIPIGVVVVLMGKSPGFYQTAVFDVFLMSSILVDFFRKRFHSRLFDTSTKNLDPVPVIFPIYLFLLFWFFIRSFDKADILIAEYRALGFGGVFQDIILSAVHSPWVGFRRTLHLFMGGCLLYALVDTGKRWIVVSLVLGFLVAVIGGLQHIAFFSELYTLCLPSYFCEAYLNFQIFPPRFNGIFGNPSWFGQYLVVVLPFICLAVVLLLRQKWYLATTVLGIFFLFGIFQAIATSQRAIWLALGIQIVAVFAFWVRHRGFNLKSTATVLGIVFVIYGISMFQTEHVKNFFQIDRGKLAFAPEERMGLWRAAFELFLDKPLIGAGPGGFYTTLAAKAPALDWTIAIPETAHNTPINILVELGGIGAFLFLLAGVYFVKEILLNWRGRYGMAVTISTIGLVIFGFFQYIFYNQAVYYSILLGLGCAMRRRSGPDAVSKRSFKTHIARPLVLLGLTCLLTLFLHTSHEKGCYRLERDANGYFKWCRPNVLLSFDKGGMKNIRILPHFTNRLTVFHHSVGGRTNSMSYSKDQLLRHPISVDGKKGDSVEIVGDAFRRFDDSRALSFQLRLPIKTVPQ